MPLFLCLLTGERPCIFVFFYGTLSSAPFCITAYCQEQFSRMIEYPACVFLKKPIRQFIPLIIHLKKIHAFSRLRECARPDSHTCQVFSNIVLYRQQLTLRALARSHAPPPPVAYTSHLSCSRPNTPEISRASAQHNRSSSYPSHATTPWKIPEQDTARFGRLRFYILP